MFASTRLGEECVEGIVATADGLVARHLTVRLNAVLQAEELPATVPDLAAGLAHVDKDRLRVSRTHQLVAHSSSSAARRSAARCAR